MTGLLMIIVLQDSLNIMFWIDSYINTKIAAMKQANNGKLNDVMVVWRSREVEAVGSRFERLFLCTL